MRDELKEKAQRYEELKTELNKVGDELEKLRRDTFGEDSKDTEEKARKLFSDVGGADENSSKTAKIDELQEEKEKLRQEKEEIKEKLRELIVNVSFPLNEEIKPDGSTISFPFSESIEQEVLDGISTAIGENLEDGDVSIGTEAIEASTDSVDEAIEAVQQRVRDIRQNAEGLLDIQSHVESVSERDDKVAAMLYVLRESEQDSMTKSDMEQKIGLDSGDLRGQLYHVLNNDPYLTKDGQDVSLTSAGEEVIDEFLRRFDIPKLIRERSGEESEDQEVAA